MTDVVLLAKRLSASHGFAMLAPNKTAKAELQQTAEE